MTRSEKIKKGLKEFFTRNLIVIILVRCGVTLTDQMINGVQGMIGDNIGVPAALPVSYTHLDVYKRQVQVT